MKDLTMLRLLPLTMLLAPLRAVAQQAPEPVAPPPYYGYGPMHMWGYADGGAFWWIPMILLFFLFLVVCGVIFLFVRATLGNGGPLGAAHCQGADRVSGDPTRAALQLLNERFARGEIQKEEYTEKKSALLSGG